MGGRDFDTKARRGYNASFMMVVMFMIMLFNREQSRCLKCQLTVKSFHTSIYIFESLVHYHNHSSDVKPQRCLNEPTNQPHRNASGQRLYFSCLCTVCFSHWFVLSGQFLGCCWLDIVGWWASGGLCHLSNNTLLISLVNINMHHRPV